MEESKRKKKNFENIRNYRSNLNRKRSLLRRYDDNMEDLKRVIEIVVERPEEIQKYCELEKCGIKTQEGVKIVKKGQAISQALMKKTEEYIRGLEKRNIIRRSTSDWRNPIRALEKPDGGIRLVSNLMALNDIVEKDPYELASIRDVIRSTYGSKYFTVIDLKEGFYSVEIEETDKHKTAFKFNKSVMNGIAW